jgi:hypothetical protein
VKLPNGAQAFVDLEKLREYVLSESHARGRHKARVFLSAFGITAAYAEELQQAPLEAAMDSEATPGEVDQFGSRYTIDFEFVRSNSRGRIRSLWIIRTGEATPRFGELLCTIKWKVRRCLTSNLLSVVALMRDFPERGLVRGQVGTVVETLAPGVFEVDFSDDDGRSYASLALKSSDVLRLHHEPLHEAA